jgi:hypothetical protein
MGGLCGLSILEGHVRGRPGYLIRDIGLSYWNAFCENRQATRGIETEHRSGRGQTFLFQQFLHSLAQVEGSGIDHPRRNLIATDFKQKVRHLENLHSE